MKSGNALLSILKVYPADLFTWFILLVACSKWGWYGLAGFYVFMVLLAVTYLHMFADARKNFFSKFELGKDDWLVQRCCKLSMHVWGDITVEEPRNLGAELFLGLKIPGRQQIMRVGNGSCIFCDKKENFVSFPYREKYSSDGDISWGSWIEMSEGFYEMYREEQETAD